MQTLKDNPLWPAQVMTACQNIKKGELVIYPPGVPAIIGKFNGYGAPLGAMARDVFANQKVYPEDIITELGL